MKEIEKDLMSESLKKVHSLMNFKPGMTRTENNEVLEEQLGTPQGTANMMGRRAVRQAKRSTKDMKDVKRERIIVKRKMDDLEGIYDKLKNRTVNGEPALDVLKAKYKEAYGEDLPNISGEPTAAPAPAAPAQSTYVPKYPPCKGGVNKVGCKSNAVAQVQSLVGGLDNQIKIDGMFGPRTKAAIEKVAPEFANQFTDADVATIKAKINAPQERAKSAAVASSNQHMNAGIKKANQQLSNRVSAQNQQAIDRIPNPLEVKEGGGATNMAIGFMNESISQKERVRMNKEIRRNKKLGIN